MRMMCKWMAVLVLVVVAGGGFVLSGVYDIGADAPHWPLTRWLITQVREHAIAHRLDSVRVPADLDDPARLAEGAEHYVKMCTGCHLAPGMDDSELRRGLYPVAPDFATMDHPIDPRKAFWVIKHGIKLTAMPAWGKTHSDEKIWDMVAFVRRLPAMSVADYRQWVRQSADEPLAAPAVPAGPGGVHGARGRSGDLVSTPPASNAGH